MKFTRTAVCFLLFSFQSLALGVTQYGISTPFDWSPTSAPYTEESPNIQHLNWQTYLRNLDRLQGRVEWVRIHTWMWLVMDPVQYKEGRPFDRIPIEKPMIWKEGLDILKRAVSEAKRRGFKVQIASMDMDHRVSAHKNSQGEYLYSFADCQQHYRNVVKVLAEELKDADGWQLFNESNQFNYRNGQWDGAIIDREKGYLKEIATLLRIARIEIKKHNPQAQIVSSTFQPWTEPNNEEGTRANRRRLQAYYDAVNPYVDFMSFNFYLEHKELTSDQSAAFWLAQLEAQTRYLRERYSKPILIGETGVPACNGADDKRQDELLRRILTKMDELQIEHVMLYTMQDDLKAFQLGQDECQYNFGLINYHGVPRISLEGFFSLAAKRILSEKR